MTSSETRRLVIIREDEEDDRRKTFVFHGEGHTLGNALRSLLLKNPLVVFVGYTIPHPSENKMHLRVETKQVQAVQALKEALQQLQALSEHVLSTFEGAMKEYRSKETT